MAEGLPVPIKPPKNPNRVTPDKAQNFLTDLGTKVPTSPPFATVADDAALSKQINDQEIARTKRGFGPAGGNTSINTQEAWVREHTLWNDGNPVVAVMETLPDGTMQQRLIGHPDNVRAMFTRVVPQAEQAKIAALESNAPPPSIFPGAWEQKYQTWLQTSGWADAPVYRLKFIDLVNKTSQTGG
jgi:hypothetical protein